MKSIYSIVSISIMILFFMSCSDKNDIKQKATQIESGCSSASSENEACVGCPSNKGNVVMEIDDQKESDQQDASIIFIELGSVNCIPCKKMQPVMTEIEKNYGSQIKIIFYDVWKPDQKKYAKEFGIRMIPTQIFLDITGKEIFRHEGFFPEKEIDAFLQKQGLKPIL